MSGTTAGCSRKISRLAFAILPRSYDEAAKGPFRTGMVLAYQSSGEFLLRLPPTG